MVKAKATVTEAKPKRGLRRTLVRGALLALGGCCVLTIIGYIGSQSPEYQAGLATRTAVAALETANYTPPPTATITPTAEPSATATITNTPQPTPSATITDTPRPTATSTPTATLVRPTHAPLADALRERWEAIDGVERVDLVYYQDNVVYGEIIVASDALSEATAEALAQGAREVLVSASIEAGFILDDGETAISYEWSNLTDEWRATEMTMVTRDAG